MDGDSAESERFVKAALLGVAVAEETRRLLRLHFSPAEVGADGRVHVEVPYPDSAVVETVLEVAAECFGQTHQDALDSLLQLAGFDDDSLLNRPAC
ncbi:MULTISPECIES: hypothetical protein [Nonomuraea]|uniref:Uncharacterized protein n=2 Tax=Nonomuraea TaxID=83681 RepID=A0A7W5VNX2_9ACTN|nr:hypothetical protein [Nonomuraea dietziae]MBB3731552.1 hypothetical protein [Nonomuraea dietziae]